MSWMILLILKGAIIYLLFHFITNLSHNRKKEPTLHFSADFISIIEIGSVGAITAACLFSSLKAGSIFINLIALLDLIVLYFESKRVILIGEQAIQIREELVPIADIIRVETSLWTLHVHTVNKTFKVMNPLVTSWQFQERVYNKLKPVRGKC